MKISELNTRAEALIERSNKVKATQSYFQRESAAASAELESAYAELDSAKKTDENGNPTGDVAAAQSRVNAARVRRETAKSGLDRADRELSEIQRQQSDTVSEIGRYSAGESGNLDKLKRLQKMKYGGNVDAFIADLASRMNAGEQARDRLLVSMGMQPANRRYSSGTGAHSGGGTTPSQVIGRMYDDGYRKRNRPSEFDSDGIRKGTWVGETFYPDDAFVPKKANPDAITFGEAKKQLLRDYAIKLDGVPYTDGYADFSSISIAKVSIEEVIDERAESHAREQEVLHGARTGWNRCVLENYVLNVAHMQDFAKTFTGKRRTPNFICADRVAARKHLPIPGLGSDYTDTELKKWRETHRFNWEESLDNGYMLVPGIVHLNLSHTGLVSTSMNSGKAEKALGKRIEKAVGGKAGEGGFVSEEDAIISIDELKSKTKK